MHIPTTSKTLLRDIGGDARDFGIERNAADQMKSRMVRRLRSLVAAIAMDNPDLP